MFKNKLGKELSLRDYQQAIKRRVFDAWRDHACVMVQMPTGTGKTHLLASVIYERGTGTVRLDYRPPA